MIRHSTTRRTNRRSAGFAVALAAAFLLTASVAEAPAAPATCSAERGQALIDEGRYQQAILTFTCVIAAAPTEVDGYRGRIEAELLLGRYADALDDYGRVTASVLPVHPDAGDAVLAGYAERLANDPDDVVALTGASFAHWWLFQYADAIKVLDRLLAAAPDDAYGTLFRGSSRLLRGVTRNAGIADLEHALALAPESPDVRFIVADAYTYGQPDPQRAFAEASLALDWGLDTPRIHAILAAALNAFGEQGAAATHIQTHIDQVTTELLLTAPLGVGQSLVLDLVPGRTYEIPVVATAGEAIVISTSSADLWDSIAVLRAPDGTPVVGSDDDDAYFAAFDWVAQETGTYTLQVTSFEAREHRSADRGARVR